MFKIIKTKATLSGNAILQTILYSDIFNFPLSKRELWYYLKNHIPIDRKEFLSALKVLPSNIIKIRNYYCIINREDLIKRRLAHERVSKKKYKVARKAALALSFIPTVCFIGISGSLAAKNASVEDDIDFFIITKKHALWVTRLYCLLILQVMGLRRSKFSQHAIDKVCLNMIIDEQRLALPISRHDVYTAHEIAQLKPLFERKNTFRKFIFANNWTRKFMPHFLGNRFEISNFRQKLERFLIWRTMCWIGAVLISPSIFEKIARKSQLWYIQKNKTNETVSLSLLAFHPQDYRLKVLAEYNSLLKQYECRYSISDSKREFSVVPPVFNIKKSIKARSRLSLLT